MKKSLVLLLLLFVLSTISQAQSRTPFEIIPQPQKLSLKEGTFNWTDTLEIVANQSCFKEAQMFVDWLNAATGKLFRLEASETWRYSKPFILFTSNDAIDTKKAQENVQPISPLYKEILQATPKESYTINVETRGIVITAANPTGIFYATQTLRQMLPASAEEKKLRLPYQMLCAQITDEPKFEHRGLNLDCCRHFMSVDFIKKQIDLLAYYKMNVLHWHLTEDQGWRIQIDKYPLLTEVGAWRTEADGSRYGGFYTKAQIKEIVAYATARHITIIPEIEMPGHSVAAIAAYPWLSCTKEHIAVENEWGVFKDIYCAGNDSTFKFMEDVLTEVCELFPGPIIHIGGDEAPKYRWEHCDKCQKRIADEKLKDEFELQTYFINRVAAFLQTKGKTIIGWDEILEGGIPNGAMVQSWRGMDGGKKAALEKHGVVMSPTSHCYFDYGLESIDTEKVYSFDPIPTDITAIDKLYIKGGECNMWSERAPQEVVEQRLYPRLQALSEVLWSYNVNRQFTEFESRLNKHYARLDAMNVKYGFATVPVKFQETNSNNEIEVTLINNPSTLQLLYGFHPEKINTKYTQPFKLAKPTELYVKALTSTGAEYPTIFQTLYWPNKAMGQPLKINYEPSPYYLGGRMMALVDGVLGSNNFRDGRWQAKQGKDLQATIEFATVQSITKISTRCFHYANAWIFRPEEVVMEVSVDGTNWKPFATVGTIIDAKTTGEFVVEYTHQSPVNVQAKFVRVTAKSIGPCPTWHDAVGEPSWIFWDEIVVE
jgi:hexosaminidase